MSWLPRIPSPYDFPYLLILEAVIGLVTAFDIKADVLVSLALIASVCIGEDFAAITLAIIGILVLAAGLYYLKAEKNDPESKKIYTAVSAVGAVIAGEATINHYTGSYRSGGCYQPDVCGAYVTIQGPTGPMGPGRPPQPEGCGGLPYSYTTAPQHSPRRRKSQMSSRSPSFSHEKHRNHAFYKCPFPGYTDK